MSAFLSLWKKELAGYFLSPIAYVVTMFFLFVTGYSFWMLTNILSQGAVGTAIMGEMFGSIFYWICVMIVIPVITMRLFSEEKRSGTIETLLTAPITDTSVVLAKYAGALTFYVVMWLPTAAYAYVLRAFDPMSTVDLGPMVGGYLGAFLVGAFYISIGLFASSLTRNQIVAAITSFSCICVAFFAGFTPYLARTATVRSVGMYFSSIGHMMDFSRGLIDTRPIILYVSGIAFMLFLTVKIVESRKWKQ